MHPSTYTTFGLLAVSVNAFWRMPCGLLGNGNARIDPLVSPGKAAQHVHALHGSNGLSYTSTYEDLRNGDCSTCAFPDDKSAYWHPAMYFKDDATGELSLVPMKGGLLVYYLLGEPEIQPFPPGFRMIAGDTNRRNYSVHGLDVTKPDPEKSLWFSLGQTKQSDLAQRALGFNCLNYQRDAEGALVRHYLPDKEYMDANCPDGIRSEIMFPSCWDGVNPTSANHMEHMAYPNLVMNGGCPDTHPKLLPKLMFEVIWDTLANKDKKGIYVYANGDPTGFGVHGDFMNGWAPDVLDRAIKECTNLSGKVEDCPVFAPTLNYENQCKVKVPEDLRNENTDKPGKVLAGNVDIQWGPNPAVPGHVPSPEEQATKERPSATYQPGVSHTPGDSFLPGQIFYATKTAWETATPEPTPAVNIQAAAPDPAPVPEPAAAAEPAATPDQAVPAVQQPAPAPTEKPTESNLRVEMKTGEDGRVTKVFYEEEIVWVTETLSITTTIKAPKVRRSHRFRHLGRRAKSHQA